MLAITNYFIGALIMNKFIHSIAVVTLVIVSGSVNAGGWFDKGLKAGSDIFGKSDETAQKVRDKAGAAHELGLINDETAGKIYDTTDEVEEVSDAGKEKVEAVETLRE